MDIYDKLRVLDKNGKFFCFQRHATTSAFYNLAIEDSKGKQHFINAETTKEIELGLDVIWSKLWTTKKIPIPIPIPKPRRS